MGQILVLSASVALSAELERSEDKWNNIISEFRIFDLTGHSVAAEKTMADRLQKLVDENGTIASYNLNAVLALVVHSTNCSSHLKFRVAKTTLLLARSPLVARGDQSGQQQLTNLLFVLEIAAGVNSGIDPKFEPGNAPGNKVTPPPELIQQGYQIPSADKSYTNSPIWEAAVLKHKARVREYNDQITRRENYAELLQLIKAIGAVPSENRTIIKQVIMGTDMPVTDKIQLEASLAPKVE